MRIVTYRSERGDRAGVLAGRRRSRPSSPGHIVATGTPAGCRSVRKPRVWLTPGDEISISSPTLGRLDTRIAR
jgi:hypothetical protein